MKFIENFTDISASALMLYYVVIILGAGVLFYKFSFKKTTIFIFLLFWAGFFSYLGSLGFLNENMFKILVCIITIYLFGAKIVVVRSKRDQYINIAFILFSISFWVSFLIHPEGFVTVSSQYILKFAFPFVVYHGIKDIAANYKQASNTAKMLLFVIFAQVIFSVFKVISLGGILEYIVGSVQFMGGGVAVSLPILGLFLFYIRKNGHLKTRDWLIAFSLLIIAVFSNKRTPVFMFPLIIFLLSVYYTKTIRFRRIIRFVPVVLVLFYFGVRTNATLNPEKSTWGSFDTQYLISYVIQYNFGTEDGSISASESTSGRGGSLIMLFNPRAFRFDSDAEMFFGKGLSEVVVGSKGRFIGGGDYEMDHEGLMGGATTMAYSLGYVTLIFYLVYIFAMLKVIRNVRFRRIFALWFIIDLFMYYNSTFFLPAMSFLSVFIIVFSNISVPETENAHDDSAANIANLNQPQP